MRSKLTWLLIVIIGLLTLLFFLNNKFQPKETSVASKGDTKGNELLSDWVVPVIDTVSNDSRGELIRYGRDLIAHTSKYLGPNGTIAKKSNGLNCQNCHIDAGARPFGNSFGAVASTYPKFRERSGKIESVEYRVNECMERSLNGKKLDSSSKEMLAMVAYVKWLGQHAWRVLFPGIVSAKTERPIYQFVG